MFKKVSKTCFIFLFISGTYFVEDVHRNERCTFVWIANDGESIVQYGPGKVNHIYVEFVNRRPGWQK